MIDYWRQRKSGRLSPLRTSIDPTEISDLLPQVFILGRTELGEYHFRLVGGLVADLHRRDLRQADFGSLWGSVDRARMAAALEASRRAAEPVLSIVEAASDEGHTFRMEVLFAPMRAGHTPPERVLGLYQPLTPLAALRGHPIGELKLIGFGDVNGAVALPRLRLAAIDGRRIA